MATYLGYQNFYLDPNTGTMKIKQSGLSLVMFKATGCKESQYIEPHFRSAANNWKEISFYILNMTENRSIAGMSKNSTTVLSKSPEFLIYVDGVPIAKHKGEITPASLRNFIVDALALVKKNTERQRPFQQSMSSYPQHQPPNSYQPPRYEPQEVHSSIAKKCDPDDDNCLKTPEGFVPHNMPWEVLEMHH